MKKRIKVKCISPRLNHIVFNESMEPHRVRVGETFFVMGIPASWTGLVIPVDGSAAPEVKVAVTNPAESEELTALKAEYKEKAGRAAHHTWDAGTLRTKISEIDEE